MSTAPSFIDTHEALNISVEYTDQLFALFLAKSIYLKESYLNQSTAIIALLTNEEHRHHYLRAFYTFLTQESPVPFDTRKIMLKTVVDETIALFNNVPFSRGRKEHQADFIQFYVDPLFSPRSVHDKLQQRLRDTGVLMEPTVNMSSSFHDVPSSNHLIPTDTIFLPNPNPPPLPVLSSDLFRPIEEDTTTTDADDSPPPRRLMGIAKK